jgi:hypothetical protein
LSDRDGGQIAPVAHSPDATDCETPGQTLGIMSFHRRLLRDYEHRLSSSASRVYWAMTDVMARRLTGTSTPSWRPM